MSKSNPRKLLRSLLTMKTAVLLALIVVPLVGATGAQLENHDSFCASCHTNPESDYVDRAQAETAVDLASFHTGEGVRCIDCHSGKGMNGRIHAMRQGAQDLVKFVSGNFPQPAPLTHPIEDINCTKCHSDISQGRDFNNHFHIFLPDWQRLSTNAAACVDCHQSHTTDGMPQAAFLHEERTVAVCQQCHLFASGRE